MDHACAQCFEAMSPTYKDIELLLKLVPCILALLLISARRLATKLQASDTLTLTNITYNAPFSMGLGGV